MGIEMGLMPKVPKMEPAAWQEIHEGLEGGVVYPFGSAGPKFLMVRGPCGAKHVLSVVGAYKLREWLGEIVGKTDNAEAFVAVASEQETCAMSTSDLLKVQKASDKLVWMEEKVSLSLVDQMRLVEIAHDTTNPQIERAALTLLQIAMNPPTMVKMEGTVT